MTPPGSLARLPLIDALRGFAVVQMIAYHFIYDLDFFGLIHVQMLIDQPWIGWRAAIVSQFIFLSGLSLALRAQRPHPWTGFWKRWLQIAAAAALVSAATRIAFGPNFIWFGILHFVAVALLAGRPLARLGGWNLVVGALTLAAGLLYANAFFAAEPWNAIGFAARKPYNVDYVPLFPWIGVFLLGMGSGALWAQRGCRLPAWALPLNRPLQPLNLLGNWSLTVYLVHQPMLIGLIVAATAAFGVPISGAP